MSQKLVACMHVWASQVVLSMQPRKTTNSKPPGRIITMGWSEALLISSLSDHSHDVLCTSHRKLCNYAEPKPFSWAKLARFDFSWPNFYHAGSHTEHHWRCSFLRFHLVCGWWQNTSCYIVNPRSMKRQKNLKPYLCVPLSVHPSIHPSIPSIAHL